jgi:hypothetical protein
MARAVEREHPDMALHLGDGWRDAEELCRRCPGLRVEKVPGNCDARVRESALRVLDVGGKRVMLCHGHTLGVKADLNRLLYAALEQGADAALFGHTHRPYVDIVRGVVLLNPGSIGDARRPTYGTLTVADGKCIPAAWKL